MLLNTEQQKAIISLVSLLAAGRYDDLEADGSSGVLSKEELRLAIEQYGRTLIDISTSDLANADVYPLSGQPNQISIDIPLRTLEEGCSDLTLSATITTIDDKFILVIEDIHVL